MAFIPFDNVNQVQTATIEGDDGTRFDFSACMSDNDIGVSCFEVKDDAPAISVRCLMKSVGLSSVDKTSGNTLRIGVNSSMTDGDLIIYAYTDSNSVTATEKINTVEITGAGDIDVTLSEAFLDELIAFDGQDWAIRITSDGTAKIRVAEMSIELNDITFAVTAVAKDNDGVVINGCEYSVYKVESLNPMVLFPNPRETGTTNASGVIAGLQLPIGDWCILWRAHNATESLAEVDMSHVFTVTA